MKNVSLFWYAMFFILLSGCTPFDKIYSHEFSSGFFELKAPNANPEFVYLSLKEDSLVVFPVIRNVKHWIPDKSKSHGININSISPRSYLYNSTFVKTSVDVDLSTVLLKFRPAAGNVPFQLSSNINGIFYTGFRKDYFKLKSSLSELNEVSSFVRHTGFDFGFFAGIGITPVNLTVTMNRITQEYDGMVFQKGFSIFGTYEDMSVGFAIGFDTLLDHNKNIWVFNNKPWFGLVFGIANF
jgi:hypothetical protein